MSNEKRALGYNRVFSRRHRLSMELKTQGLDRLLEALSPALAAELDRVAQETRETLEREFQDRLRSAVEQAEAAAKTAAAAEFQQSAESAIEDLKRMSEEADVRLKQAV